MTKNNCSNSLISLKRSILGSQLIQSCRRGLRTFSSINGRMIKTRQLMMKMKNRSWTNYLLKSKTNYMLDFCSMISLRNLKYSSLYPKLQENNHCFTMKTKLSSENILPCMIMLTESSS